jgi:hypothetical protein
MMKKDKQKISVLNKYLQSGKPPINPATANGEISHLRYKVKIFKGLIHKQIKSKSSKKSESHRSHNKMQRSFINPRPSSTIVMDSPS